MSKRLFIKMGFLLFLLLISDKNALSQSRMIDSVARLMKSPSADTMSNEMQMKNYLMLSSAQNQSNPELALTYGRLALNHAEIAKNTKGKAMAINMLGIAYYMQSNYDSARACYDQAMALFVAISDTLGIIHTLNNKGILLKSSGNYEASIRNYKQVLDIAERLKRKDMLAYTMNNVAIVYYEWKLFEPAIEHYMLALSYLAELGDTLRMAPLFNNLGELYRELGKSDSAYFYFQEALLISRRSNLPKTLINAYINLGDLRFDEKNHSDALNYYSAAYNAAAAAALLPAKASSAIRIGNVQLALNNPGEAEKFISEGLGYSRKLKDPKILQEAHLAAFNLYKASGNARDALDHYMHYTLLKDSLFNVNSQKEIDRLRTEFETKKKENEIILLNQEKAHKELEIERQKILRFYTIIVAVLVLVILYMIYVRYKQRQERLKNQLERARIDIEHKLLRSQMNPHFLFNSINTVNGFILTKDIDAATEFLAKFALLVRLILENSRKEMVLFTEELKTIKLYLELEQKRFINRFSYEIQIDDSIVPDETYLPPMLIQPFIENAIIHGLRLKQEGGLIRMHFKRYEYGLIVEIIDNGLGRAQSALYQQTEAEKHESLGLQLTYERLSVLSGTGNDKYRFEITDLLTDSGDSAGTKVVVWMPCEID